MNPELHQSRIITHKVALWYITVYCYGTQRCEGELFSCIHSALLHLRGQFTPFFLFYL